MRIREQTVVEVVQEASTKMSDANYSAVMVGGFVQGQRAACQYISSFADELGGPEAVVNTIFHASLIALCFQRGYSRSVRAIQFDELDHVSDGDREAALKIQQPAILEYIEANVEDATMRKVLVLLSLAMELVS